MSNKKYQKGGILWSNSNANDFTYDAHYHIVTVHGNGDLTVQDWNRVRNPRRITAVIASVQFS